MLNQVKTYQVFTNPFDPCPPRPVKTYVLPPNLFMEFQPPGLQQFSPEEALRLGTLWPALYSPYETAKGEGPEDGK
ncbi:spore coat associated protein CotJA [Paenibacillus turpanensis]|uniref:spore coat associated protein CotJA n=1 Tax=Paenibacillus turpanensis TaxID=2689078 RepID=UPI00140C70C4|nr:spore coat associated protein CotJA [Paenibacillus turpanensis]